LKTLIIISSFLFAQLSLAQSRVIKGYVFDSISKESLIGVTVFDEKNHVGTISNSFGFYSVSVSGDSALLSFSYVGYKPVHHHFKLKKDSAINVSMSVEITQLREVKINVAKKNVENGASFGQINIDPKKLNTMPSFAGETDPLKIMQLMPGVKSGQEGTNGIYVRGGNTDQNLILLDDAPVYNPGHLLGFFSVFNNDAIKDVKLLKGGFDAQYGGRLSSVIDIRTEDGNMQKTELEGGVGLLSSRITVQGPIRKDTISYMIGARRSYIDQLSKLANFPVPYYFYDLNGKVNYKINAKTRLYLSAYYGNDVLKIDQDDKDRYGSLSGFGFNLLNSTATVRLNREHSAKLFANYSLITTGFGYDVSGQFSGNSILVRSTIRDWGGKVDYSYYLNNKHFVKFGATVTAHVFTPNFISTSGEITEFIKSRKPIPIYMTEYAAYISDQYKITKKWMINYGLRTSGAIVQGTPYLGLEPRASLAYQLKSNFALKASYSRMRQYMHLVSSSTVSLPTDLWYPVTHVVKPLYSDQFSAGSEWNIPKTSLRFIVEGYYKKMHNVIQYKEGAEILLNDNFEQEILFGKSEAYGAEFFLQKNSGKFNGWVAYTLSWSLNYFDELNGGKAFYSKFDRRHDLSIVMNYSPNKKWNFSAVWVYMTGARFTAQIGQYIIPNSSLTDVNLVPIYTSRNAVTMSPTHRLDVSATYFSPAEKKFKYELVMGVYNVYNRASPFVVEIGRSSNGSLTYQQPGLFGMVPYFSFNFKI
jgi:hypothetical protein